MLEAVEGVPSNLSVLDSINSTLIYRVRNFTDAKEAKGYIFTNTIDLGVRTISSYIVITKGTKVNRLCCKKIGIEEV